MLLFIILFFSCKQERQASILTDAPKIIEASYATQIQKIVAFAQKSNYNTNIAFMIDYSLHSGKNRFFVVDLKKEKIIKKGLVCHGSCKGKNKNDQATTFSNTPNSYCTTLGIAVMGERAYSKWGKNYKYWIDGLETSNSNMRKRVVVLHAWEYVPDKEVYPNPIALSWGCPTVSIKFLDELDEILQKHKKVLLYSFN